MRKYWALYKAGLQNALTYRGPMVVWKVTNLLSFLTIAYVWLSSDSTSFGGYNKPQLITYYFFVLFLQWIVTLTPVMSIKEEIKSGEINSKILKPFSYLGEKFALETSWHTISPLLGLVVLGIAFIFFRSYLEFSPSFPNVLLFLITLPLSGLICFFISFSFGLLAFWFTEIDSLTSIFWLCLFLLGGQGIPVSFFPSPVREVVTVLPFRYIYSFPLEIIFNKLTLFEILTGFLTQAAWVVGLYLLARQMWLWGLHVYAAFGG